MKAIRKAILSLGLTIFGLTLGFVIMAHDMPQVYPGMSELKAFVAEKVAPAKTTDQLTDLQRLRERTGTLPVEAQGMGPPIGGGAEYCFLDVFRMKQVFRPNDAPTQTHRTRPGQQSNGPSLPTIGETRKSNNSLLGSL